MKLNAGLDPIIAILVGVGWFIVKALMNRREDADSWDDMERPAPPRPQAPPPQIPQAGSPTLPPPIRPAPVVLAPQKRPAPPPTPPLQRPPIVRTTAPPRPPIISEREGPTAVELAKLKESRESYARAASLQKTVAQRLTAIDQQTTAHKPAGPKPRTRPTSSAHILRTMRNPITIRQAFLASFVLNPPKALE